MTDARANERERVSHASGAGSPSPRAGVWGSPRGEAPRIKNGRLLILWLALACVVWNGVYDMRMHDAARGYLLETALAQAGLGRGVDMRVAMHRGLVDAVAFSTAWGLGVLLAGLITLRALSNAECRMPNP